MKTYTRIFRHTLLALLILTFLSGCGRVILPQEEELRTENHSVELGGASSARVQIEMDMGELTINSGSSKLMEGTFDYTVDDRRPEVNYKVSGGRGDLLVSQPEVGGGLISRGGQNRWDLHFSDSIPMDMEVYTGIADSQLNLRAIDLTHLQIESGAGDGIFDLSGMRPHDLTVTIKGGLGDITVILPREMGVRVQLSSGLGKVNMSGFSKNGDVYVNDAYGESSETVELQIESAVGAVDLQLQ